MSALIPQNGPAAEERPSFSQNVIALVWDFDKTLSPHDMQRPIFRKFGVDERAFWDEVNALAAQYRERGVTVNPDLLYLNHLLSAVAGGLFKGLNNALLRELGREIELFEGLPEFFDQARSWLEAEKYRSFDLKLEHYIVSAGLKELILGSAMAGHVDGVWACEFIEDPTPPQGCAGKSPYPQGQIAQIGYAIDNTTKTRAIFEINKGVNKHPDLLHVNSRIPTYQRRVPIENMIGVGDGPSDIPAFSVLRQGRGGCLAVYEPGSERSFEQVNRLLAAGRVDFVGPAQYKEGTPTAMWLKSRVIGIADRIVRARASSLLASGTSLPRHS